MGIKNKIQRGLTLIELSIVLMILAALAVVSTRFMFDEFDRSIADKTVAEMWAVAEYSVAYYSENGKWPDEEADCASAPSVMADDSGLLKGIELDQSVSGGVTTTNGVYSPWSNNSGDKVKYVLSCDKDDTYKGFQISLTIPDFPGDTSADEEWAQYILQKLPLAKLDDADKSRIILTMPPPAGVVALRDYLSRKEDPKRKESNEKGEASLNDLEAVININTDVSTGERKVVDFDVDDVQNFDGEPAANDYFDKDTAIYSLNMPRTSVFNKVVLIPTTSTGIPVDDGEYYRDNCRDGSPGGFALEVCERDYQAHVHAEDGNLGVDKLKDEVDSTPRIQKAGDSFGSIKANDIYLKSIGKWASEIDNEMIPNWMLVEHYTDKMNGDSILYTECPKGRAAKYEIWQQKINVTKPSPFSGTDVSGHDYTITYEPNHIFSINYIDNDSDGKYDDVKVSIYWPGERNTEEKNAEGAITEVKSVDNFYDSDSLVYANVYCVKS